VFTYTHYPLFIITSTAAAAPLPLSTFILIEKPLTLLLKEILS